MARYVGILIEYNEKTGFGKIAMLLDGIMGDEYFIHKEEYEKVNINSKDIGSIFSFEIGDHGNSAININRYN